MTLAISMLNINIFPLHTKMQNYQYPMLPPMPEGLNSKRKQNHGMKMNEIFQVDMAHFGQTCEEDCISKVDGS